MTRVKVNRISEKGINLPPSEYDDEQPIIVQVISHKEMIIGLDPAGNLWEYRQQKIESVNKTIFHRTPFGYWETHNPKEY